MYHLSLPVPCMLVFPWRSPRPEYERIRIKIKLPIFWNFQFHVECTTKTHQKLNFYNTSVKNSPMELFIIIKHEKLSKKTMFPKWFFIHVSTLQLIWSSWKRNQGISPRIKYHLIHILPVLTNPLHTTLLEVSDHSKTAPSQIHR